MNCVCGAKLIIRDPTAGWYLCPRCGTTYQTVRSTEARSFFTFTFDDFPASPPDVGRAAEDARAAKIRALRDDPAATVGERDAAQAALDRLGAQR